jgi:hypothetical protein
MNATQNFNSISSYTFLIAPLHKKLLNQNKTHRYCNSYIHFMEGIFCIAEWPKKLPIVPSKITDIKKVNHYY